MFQPYQRDSDASQELPEPELLRVLTSRASLPMRSHIQRILESADVHRPRVLVGESVGDCRRRLQLLVAASIPLPQAIGRAHRDHWGDAARAIPLRTPTGSGDGGVASSRSRFRTVSVLRGGTGT